MSPARKFIVQTLIALMVIAVGITGFSRLKAGKQSMAREMPEVPLPMVRTVAVSTGPMRMVITGQGTVAPDREIQLVPQVRGKVTGMSPSLVNGGIFKHGDLLIEIEADDYEIAVTLAEARVREAESLYEQTRENSAAAIAEWESLNPREPPPDLVAKKPQMDAVRAKREAERASLTEARLNLKRTRLTAPFNGRVAAEHIDIGQYVVIGQSLAVLQSTDAAEIVIPVEDSDLLWFDAPGFTTQNGEGASADVFAEVAGRKTAWSGRLVRTEGRINERTRMHQVVVRVDRPYDTLPPLAAGQFVEIAIHGTTLDHAAVIPRAALHENDTVWVVTPADSRLRFRKVSVARTDVDGVVIQDGLGDEDRVVVSSLKAVSDGMKVRYVESTGKEPS